jgi:hypothetical protein
VQARFRVQATPMALITTSGAKEYRMAVQAQGWERRLIDLAQEALETQIAAAWHGIFDDDDLSAAYRVCEQVTKSHSRTFMMASSLYKVSLIL